MAQTVTLEGLRSQAITNLYGRRLGLALGNSSDTDQAGYMVGPKGFRSPINNYTTASTAAGDILPYGVATFGTSTTGGTTFHSVRNPVPGGELLLLNLSTGYQAIWLNGDTGTTGVTGAGVGDSGVFATTQTSIKLTGKGSWARLVGISTSQWGIQAQVNTSVTTWGTSIT